MPGCCVFCCTTPDPACPWQDRRVPSADDGFDPASLLERIEAETRRLLDTVAALDDAGVRAPSLLPGWSRGHVLTHLARNADGGRRLLSWARTGIETAEYASMAARAREIEAGAGRRATDLLADVRHSAARFAQEYVQMPTPAWGRTVRWTSGQQHPAARAADSRLTEVLVHHVDLDAGYTPGDWPPDFVATMLDRIVASLAVRPDTPALRLHAADIDRRYEIGHPAGAQLVGGSAPSVLAWLMGRSSGTDLETSDAPAPPTMPFLY
jgi:maleylpyruvate isomerase